MKVEFDKSFSKAIDKVKNKIILKKLMLIIEKLEKADKLDEISNVKKLTGFTKYYRLKLGDYRLGFEKIDHRTVRLLQFAHRKDIYSLFP